MKNRISILLCIILAVSSITGLYGQKSGKKVTITGIVVDVAATPVANAVIMVDGEKTDNITNSKGYYKIKVRQDNKKIGVFNATGGILEEDINGRKNIDFTFKVSITYQKTDQADDQVDIGYGKVKKKDVMGSVGKIDGTKSKYAGYNSIFDLIRGEVPGVDVHGTTIIIRSITSINGNTDPLFVVDGVPVNAIDNIQPEMVKSIEVLKGSSASIYGSRGSNGVILIHLLKGTDK
jgi:TonB-dependent SusC/RagA subfamily outer membrane receptor